MNTLTNKRTGACGLAMLLALTLCAALGVVAVSATPALAKTYNEKWTVEFTGDKMVDEGTANITKTLSGMQPGDSACFTIQLKGGPRATPTGTCATRCSPPWRIPSPTPTSVPADPAATS